MRMPCQSGTTSERVVTASDLPLTSSMEAGSPAWRTGEAAHVRAEQHGGLLNVSSGGSE